VGVISTFSSPGADRFLVLTNGSPEAIEGPLTEMEAKGDLAPVAQSVVQDFQGRRIARKHVEIPVTVLKVKSAIETKPRIINELTQIQKICILS
jgi:hypothetical protein